MYLINSSRPNDPCKQRSAKFRSNYKTFHVNKCVSKSRLQNECHFVQDAMCLYIVCYWQPHLLTDQCVTRVLLSWWRKYPSQCGPPSARSSTKLATLSIGTVEHLLQMNYAMWWRLSICDILYLWTNDWKYIGFETAHRWRECVQNCCSNSVKKIIFDNFFTRGLSLYIQYKIKLLNTTRI